MSHLERIRNLHEEIEQLNKAAAKILENKPKVHREALLADLKLSAYSLQAQNAAQRLHALYLDADGTRRQEYEALGVNVRESANTIVLSRMSNLPSWMTQGATLLPSSSSSSSSSSTTTTQSSGNPTYRTTAASLSSSAPIDPVSLFYQRLADVRSGSGGGSSSGAGAASSSSVLETLAAGVAAAKITDAADEAALKIVESFTDEELFGKYLDMQSSLFEQFCNLPGVKEARYEWMTTSSSSTHRNATKSSSIGGGGVAAKEYAEAAKADYSMYLKRLPELHASLPVLKTKATPQYLAYIASLASYLAGFFQRRYPLADLQDMLVGGGVQQQQQGGSEAGAENGASASLQQQGTVGWLTEFELAWKGRYLPGWVKSAPTTTSNTKQEESTTKGSLLNQVDLLSFASEEAMVETLGAEGIKLQLSLRGLKQGGSPSERATRLWSVRGLAPNDYPKKFRVPPPASASSGTTTASATTTTTESRNDDMKGSNDAISSTTNTLIIKDNGVFVPVDVLAIGRSKLLGVSSTSISATTTTTMLLAAWCETVVSRLAILLEDILKDTRKKIEKRQTRTFEENRAERNAELEEVTTGASSKKKGGGDTGEQGGGGGGNDENENDDDDDDDDEEKPIYNPLNLPLGWDGKPIPYWLYRLHGLNIEFPCEICGGASYRGRRDYDRHFQEPKHAAGMRALEIPNTKHFHDITKIADAQKLYERIRHTITKDSWKAEAGEEYEDSSGNVLNRKTYEDLARQGLL